MAKSEKSAVKPLLLMIAFSALAFAAGMAIQRFVKTVEATNDRRIIALQSRSVCTCTCVSIGAPLRGEEAAN
jgi:hypothetical protein